MVLYVLSNVGMAAKLDFQQQIAVLMSAALVDALLLPLLLVAYKWLFMGRVTAGMHDFFSPRYIRWTLGGSIQSAVEQGAMVSTENVPHS
jgi:hypothetical protein